MGAKEHYIAMAIGQGAFFPEVDKKVSVNPRHFLTSESQPGGTSAHQNPRVHLGLANNMPPWPELFSLHSKRRWKQADNVGDEELTAMVVIEEVDLHWPPY